MNDKDLTELLKGLANLIEISNSKESRELAVKEMNRILKELEKARPK